MDDLIRVVLGTASALVFISLAGFVIVSWREGERRAASVSLAASVVLGLIFLGVSSAPASFQILFVGFLSAAGIIVVVLFLLPVGKVEVQNDIPIVRIDERDIPFARAKLQPGSPEYESYYSRRPENKAVDERFRLKPGLLNLDASLADAFQFASTIGSFWLTEGLRESVDGPVSDVKRQLPTAEMSQYLKDLARYYGALDVGICELQPYHYYSHIGRGSGTYGDPVPFENRYGIAFTVEMDYEMIGPSPNAPVLMESGKQYVEAARVAVQLAAAIRYLGYAARAHIDGNYRVIAPLAARDAGLGEIGRMGILMTPRQGPRVRVGVVTTTLELLPDKRKPDNAMIDFCTVCKKCAENCPSRSIPFEERREIDGVMRWKINSDTCFLYWNVIGTDCAKCLAVCPYSHADNVSHNIIRWGIERSGAFRRGALWMDDLFYGKKPISRKAPAWTQVKKRS